MRIILAGIRGISERNLYANQFDLIRNKGGDAGCALGSSSAAMAGEETTTLNIWLVSGEEATTHSTPSLSGDKATTHSTPSRSGDEATTHSTPSLSGDQATTLRSKSDWREGGDTPSVAGEEATTLQVWLVKRRRH